MHLAQVVTLPVGEVGLETQVGQPDHGVHGRADLVAHIGEKIALGPRGRLSRILCTRQRLLGALLLGNIHEYTHEPADDTVRQLKDGLPIKHVVRLPIGIGARGFGMPGASGA